MSIKFSLSLSLSLSVCLSRSLSLTRARALSLSLSPFLPPCHTRMHTNRQKQTHQRETLNPTPLRCVGSERERESERERILLTIKYIYIYVYIYIYIQKERESERERERARERERPVCCVYLIQTCCVSKGRGCTYVYTRIHLCIFAHTYSRTNQHILPLAVRSSQLSQFVLSPLTTPLPHSPLP